MLITYTLGELSVVSKFLTTLNERIFLLDGDLGAGKTNLVNAFCRNMKFNNNVSSPTFSLVNTYQNENTVLHHFDLYRIEQLDELLEIGFEEYLLSDAYVFIEWPKVAKELLQNIGIYIVFKIESEFVRTLNLKKNA